MNIINIVGNYLLINGTHTVEILGMSVTVPGAGWGVAGAAVSTGFSWFIGGTALLVMLFVKKDWSILIWLPCLFIIGATQCRKAFVMLVMGMFLMYYYKQRMKKNGDMLLPLTKVFVFVLIGFLVLFILGHNGIFSGLYTRMGGMISALTGGEDVDASSMVRNIYNEIGWKQFLKTPIVGIGINNSMILLAQQVNHATYLHNNYIELLTCGGVIGLISYYSIFEQKYIKLESSAFLIVTWLLIIFVIDWGVVSYINRMNYFYLMMFFIHLDHLKKKYPHIK